MLYCARGVRWRGSGRSGSQRTNATGTTALDWYYPSEDGTLLAYGLSENGSEQSVLHVLEVETGRLLPERIPRTRAAALAWLPDDSGFYYTRYPAPGAVPPGKSTTTAASTSIGWAPTAQAIRWSTSRRRRNTGPG